MRTINGIRVYKNIICIVLIAGLIMSITACGNKAKENKEFVTEGSVSDERISTGGDAADNSFMNLSTVFNKDESFHLNNVKGWIIDVVLIKDELFFYTNETVTSDISGTSGDATEEKNVVRFYKADADGGEAQLLAEIESGNKTYVDRMLVDGNSNIFVTKTKWISDERNMTKIYSLRDGSLTDKKDISSITDVSGDSWLDSLFVDADGDFVAVYDNAVKIYSKSLKVIADAKMEHFIEASCITGKGNVAVAVKDRDNKETLSVKILDKEKGDIIASYPIDSQYIDRLITGDGTFDFYYQTSDGIYGYNENVADVKIADFNKSEIDIDKVGNVLLRDSNSMYMISRSGDTNTLVCYKRSDSSRETAREVLTIKSENESYELKQHIAEYNNSQNEYMIKLIEHEDVTVPDIYGFSDAIDDTPIEIMVKNNMLMDLSEMIYNDPDLSMDELVPVAKDAMMLGGGLYFISPSFKMSSLIGKKDKLGDDGWTCDELKDYTDSLDKSTRLLYTGSKNTALRQILENTLSEYVDWDNGEAHFDSDSFEKLLQSISIGIKENASVADSEPDSFSGDKVGLYYGDITPDMLQIYNDICGELCFKGFPSDNRYVVSVSFPESYAVSADCENKDAAWGFIRSFLSEQYQGENLQTLRGIPTRRDVYEEYIKDKCTKDKIIDAYGNSVIPLEGGVMWDNKDIKLRPLTREETEQFEYLISNSGIRRTTDKHMLDIVTDISDKYFSGELQLDDTINMIQEETTDYMNSN